jgi:hypothetical protein
MDTIRSLTDNDDMSRRHYKSNSKPPGRPVKREIKLEATPEQVVRAMFSAVKKPDPTLRKTKATSREKK